jgi:Zn-finger nucleic acid-binding protein
VNCSNCGAPLTPVPGRDYLQCKHCETVSFPEPLADSADGVTPLGEPAEHACPVCFERLVLGSIAGYEVSYCEPCRGVLTTNADFPQIVRKRREECPPAESAAPLNPEELNRRIDCPACGQRMETHPYHGGGNAVIDPCVSCHLIWFDAGELAAIVAAPRRAPRLAEPTLFSRFGPAPAAPTDSYGPDGMFIS